MLRERVLSAGLILMAGMAVAKLLDLVGMLLVARMVSPEGFGIVATCLITYQFVAVITQMNTSDALIQRETLEERDLDRAFSLNMVRGLIIYIVLLISSLPISWMIDNPDVIPVLSVMGLGQVLFGLRNPKLVEFKRKVRPLRPALTELIGKTVGFIALAIVAYVTQSYWAIVVGMVFGQLVSVVISYLFAPYRPRLEFRGIGWLLSFSIWFNLNSIANAINAQFDRFYTGYALDEVALGIYTLATSIGTQLIWALAAPLMNALFAGLALVKSEPEKLKNAYLLGQQVIFISMIPIGVGLALIAKPLTLFLLGEEWLAVAPVIAIIAPATALFMLAVGPHSLALAKGRPDKVFWRTAALVLLTIPATIFAITNFGMTGAAWVRALSNFIFVILSLQMARVLSGASIAEQLKNCARPAASVIIMALVVTTFVSNNFGFHPTDASILAIIKIAALGALTYFASSYLLWSFAGKPDGAERFFFNTLQKVLGTKREAPQSSEG